MIQLIVQLFSTISNGFYYLFWTSYSIGKLISWILCSAVNVLALIWNNIREAGTIFSEDFLIFLKDLLTVATNIIDAGKESILTSGQFFYSIIHVTFTTISELFTTGTVHTANVGQQCFNSFTAMMNALKNLFVLIGNGSWFILTLVPTLLMNILAYMHHVSMICFDFTWKLNEAIWTHIKEITSASVNYFLDVPLQAIIGCSFIVLLVMHRRVTLRFITWLTVRLLQYLQTRALCVFASTLSAFRRRRNIINNRPRQSRTFSAGIRLSPMSPQVSPPNTKQNSNEENVCVICRDEPKSVVLMPCRHLCLCQSCNGSIWTCPLCRKQIRNTISVYT